MKQRKTTVKFNHDGVDYSVQMWNGYGNSNYNVHYHVYDNSYRKPLHIGCGVAKDGSTKFDIVALSVDIIKLYQSQENFTKPVKIQPETLDDKIIALLEEHHTDHIFNSIVNNASKDGLTWLTDAAIAYLQTYKGYNIVKADGLAQQMQLEETLQKLYPYATQEGSNLFLAVC